MDDFQLGISKHEMYPEDDFVVKSLLNRLAVNDIVQVCKF
jgi:hypothetical protein